MFLFYFFGFEACGFLAPCPGIGPIAPCIGRWSPNHWTARDVPQEFFYIGSFDSQATPWGNGMIVPNLRMFKPRHREGKWLEKNHTVICWTGIWTKAILLLTTVLYFWFEIVCTGLTMEPLGLDCCASQHSESIVHCSHNGLYCNFPCIIYRTLQVEKRKNVTVISIAGVSTPAYPACVLSCFSHVWFFMTLRTVDSQASLFMGFSGQEYWSGLPCPPQGIFLTQGSNPHLFTSPALAGFFTISATWEAPSNPTSCY